MACDWLQQINLMNFYGNVRYYANKPKHFCEKLKHFYFSFIAIVTTA